MPPSPAFCAGAGGSALPGSPSPGAAGGQGAATHGAEAQGAGVSADRWKLANRLKGRLGYLGVYYKRDPRR